MASKVPVGAKRTDNGFSYSPDNLHLLRLGEDASRDYPTTDADEILASPELVERFQLMEMAHSLARNGQGLPGAVKVESDGYGALLDGRRRFLGMTLVNRDPGSFMDRDGQPLKAGLDFRFVTIRCDDEEALEISMITNLQRLDLDIIDRANAALKASQKYGWTQAHIGKVMGFRSQGNVSMLLRVAEMPKRAKNLLRAGKLHSSDIKLLGGLAPKEIDSLCAEIEKGVSAKSLMESLKAKKREKGKSLARTRTDLMNDLARLDSERARLLAEYMAGDPKSNLADILSDDALDTNDNFVMIGGQPVEIHEEN